MARIPDPFPAAEDDGCEPFRAIAHFLSCNEIEVLDAFDGLPIPEWSGAVNLNNMNDLAETAASGMKGAKKLQVAMARLSETDIEQMRIAGLPSEDEIARLLKDLEETHRFYQASYDAHSRTGGRKPDVHIIAEGLRRLFEKKGWYVGFFEAASSPSSDFGRAVEFSLAAFGVNQKWRAPTQAAHKRHKLKKKRTNTQTLGKKS